MVLRGFIDLDNIRDKIFLPSMLMLKYRVD